MKISLFALLFFFAFQLISCAHGNCPNAPQRKPAGENQTTQQNDSEQTPVLAAASKEKPKTTQKSKAQEKTIQVFKPTGELQCGERAGVPAEKMQKELDKVKVKVLSSKTTHDGMMHMTVCGAETGQINLYEIPASDLKKATKVGFKVFEPQPQ